MMRQMGKMSGLMKGLGKMGGAGAPPLPGANPWGQSGNFPFGRKGGGKGFGRKF